MKIKNIEYRAMADGKHKAVQAIVVEDDGTERRATLGEIRSVEGFRTAAAQFLCDHNIGLVGLLNSPELLSRFKKDWIIVLYKARGGKFLSVPQFTH